ncbi:hypothetical protein D3C81_1762700 [compost metagenome]
MLKQVDITQVFGLFMSIGIDNDKFTFLCNTFCRAFDLRLVNTFFSDFITYIVGSVDIKLFFIHFETDGNRRCKDQNQGGHLQLVG